MNRQAVTLLWQILPYLKLHVGRLEANKDDKVDRPTKAGLREEDDSGVSQLHASESIAQRIPASVLTS